MPCRRSAMLALATGALGWAAPGYAQNAPNTLLQTIRVAAASDLKFALADVLNQFQRDTGLSVVATYGSSGQFARQIDQGLPTDLFMSADETLVAQLADKGLTQGPGALYALGRLALIVPHGSPLATQGGWPSVLDSTRSALNGPKAFITQWAIANPQHAPYGRAAQQALRALGLWDSVQKRLVLGDNIAQATQFVTTGAAQAGLTAWALALAPEVAARTRYALVPDHLHTPLRQRMVLLKSARPQAKQLFDYLQSAPVRLRLRTMGFGMP